MLKATTFKILLILLLSITVWKRTGSLLAQTVKADFYQPYIPLIKWPCNITAVGDMNDDGRMDVLIGTTFSNNPLGHHKLMVYFQNVRTVVNILPISYSVNGDTISCIKVGDLNSNLKSDVLVGAGDEVAIFIQDTAIKLIRDTLLYSGQGVRDVEIGDLNQDGRNDFVVFHARENFIRVFYQDSTGTYTSQTYPCPGSPRGELAIADLNKDSLPDILVMTSNPPALHILHNAGNGQFNPPVFLSSPTPGTHTFEAMAIGDFFGDGLTDVAISLNQGDSLRQLEIFSQTKTGLQQYTTAVKGGESLNAADLNCDGRVELYSLTNEVSPNFIFNPLFIYYFDPSDTNFSKGLPHHQVLGYGSPMKRKFDPSAISHGDINSDGKIDIVIADTSYGRLLSYNKTPVQPTIIGDSVFDTLSSAVHDTLSSTATITTTHTVDTTFGFYSHTTFITQILKTYVLTSTQVTRTHLIYKQQCERLFTDTSYTTKSIQDSTLLKVDTTVSNSQTQTPWEHKDFDKHLTFYPNPTSGEVWVEVLKSGGSEQVMKIEMYTTDGKRLASQQIVFTNKGKLNLGHLAPATYHVVVHWKGFSFVRSFIKK